MSKFCTWQCEEQFMKHLVVYYLKILVVFVYLSWFLKNDNNDNNNDNNNDDNNNKKKKLIIMKKNYD